MLDAETKTPRVLYPDDCSHCRRAVTDDHIPDLCHVCLLVIPHRSHHYLRQAEIILPAKLNPWVVW